jgi:hypothetical protein
MDEVGSRAKGKEKIHKSRKSNHRKIFSVKLFRLDAP